MSEKYYDQKLKEFLGVVLQAHGYQGATTKAFDDYADAVKKCTIKYLPFYLNKSLTLLSFFPPLFLSLF